VSDLPRTDAILAAVRDLEGLLVRKTFWTSTERDVDAYRDDLIRRGQITGEGRISRSTMRHRASYVRTFLDWLVDQDFGHKMPRLLSAYLVLRQSHVAVALQPSPREIPTSEEVKKILTEMPVKTLIQRRDRAILAASILFGTRSETTASLRISTIDMAARKVLLDTTKVRIKNSKSQTTFWFPRQRQAEDIVVGWIEELIAKGAQPGDALFPPDLNLAYEQRLTRTYPGSVEPWKTDAGVRRAFRNGCGQAEVNYFNPHSIKHYLKSVRDEFCRTPEHRQAFSYNLGHENEKITEACYAKMTDTRRDAIFMILQAGSIPPVPAVGS
jgi:integrase